MHSRRLSWAQGFFVAALSLSLLIIIPSAWFPLQLGKVTLSALLMLVSIILFALQGAPTSFMRGKNLASILLVAALPIVYLLSYLHSIDPSVGLAGYTIESDTLIFVTLGFITFALAQSLFRSTRSARLLLWGTSAAAALAGVFQFVVLVASPSALPAIFSDRSVNLVGKWNDLGFMVGLLFLFLLIAYEFGALTLARRIASVVGMVLCALLLAIINFPLIWSLLLASSLGIAVWAFVSRRGVEAGSRMTRLVPWVPLGVVLVSIILIVWGTVVNTGLTSVFPVSSLEVRPSAGSTITIEKASHGSSVSRFLLGTGPQTFGEDWLMHKPATVNATPFWNLDFTVGYSSLLTVLGSVGLLGVLAWVMPLILVLISLVYTLRSAHFSAQEKLYAAYLGLGALFLWGGFIFYVPSQMLILLTMGLSGAAVGFALSKFTHPEARRHVTALSWAVLCVLAALLCWTSFITTRRYVAEAYTNQGLVALQNNNIDEAQTLAKKAQGVEQTGDDLRLGVSAGLAKLQSMAANTQNPTKDELTAFVNQAQDTIPQGQAAIKLNPQDYRAYLSLGEVYDLLASLKVSGAYENAKAAYDAAAVRNPSSPQIPLLLARLEAGQGNLKAVQTDLTKSLTLKSDYTDAILFVVQLDVAQKDLPNAVRAATAAVQSAPGVPSIWFELGLLYYTGGDYKDAVTALGKALELEPNYANAQYFLGLSFANLGRTSDAIAQFTALSKTNPDNQEVKLILSNLEAGKPPFSGAQPPVTNTPQDRTQAPISQ